MVWRKILLLILLFIAGFCLDLSIGYGVSEQLWMEVLYPGEIAFSYKIRPARNFGDVMSKPFNRIKLVPTEPSEGCSHIFNGNRLRGQVALIKRGDCSFVTKSLNAELYGSVAVVIRDSDPDGNTNWIDMIGDGTNRDQQVGIPVFFMLGKDGHMISQSLHKHNMASAIINLPVNYTNTAVGRQPPWDFW